ncbi:hypothetical protein AN191_12400 [Loktanella sp. 5RATIMAR09]|uniref:hypothetical protein n=1 Tax=Loktanella sp. 5RATIMAR09 TaxID=1225655 RepID=UPI0006EBD624|nr:hypothetical protein [Loktanella sp. 5RATIMAR09]KQI71421.1 hypothetical protein AN191_12400 [Loktanella sp. 5RATIMAR09]
MTNFNLFTGLGVGAMILLGACAPRPEPVAMVIYAEPTFDKLGNPSCRPGDVPMGGVYTEDLPLCAVLNNGQPVVVVPRVAQDVDSDGGGVSVDPVDPNGGNQHQNENQNQNQNQNENQNQSGG